MPDDQHRLDPSRPYADQVVIVTGAARGIGLAIADLLAERGATVVRGDVLAVDAWDDSRADGTGLRVVADVTSRDSCEALVAATVQKFGRVTGLVNNAGIVTRGPAEHVTDAEFDAVMDVNLKGTLRMCQSVFEALRTQGGAIVNLGSTNGHVAVPNTLGYCLSKAAVMHMAKVLAFEWARHDIRVNAVAPTIVPTDMTADVRADADYMRDKMASIPLHRMASPRDVAEAVCYLMSPGAGMITGQTIFVDGGVTLG